MAGSFQRLTVGLKAIAQFMQQLSHHPMAGLMAQTAEFFRQLANTLGGPAQPRLRVAPRDRFHQTLQINLQGGVRVDGLLAASARPTHSADLHTWRFVEFPDSLNN